MLANERLVSHEQDSDTVLSIWGASNLRGIAVFIMLSHYCGFFN